MNLFEFDEQFNKTIVGTDEAGRGPGAGGVFAAAVCFREKSDYLIQELEQLNDSKQLKRRTRERLYDIILNNTINATVCVEVEEIEKINILNASLKAMKLACEGVIREIFRPAPPNDVIRGDSEESLLVMVDGNRLIKKFSHPQQCIIKGDGKSASIAAASVLAKVARDRYMERLHEKFPQYGWNTNAGYLTPQHLDSIEKYGLTPHHRPSFLKKQLTLTFRVS